MIDCAAQRPGMLLFQPPQTDAEQPAHLRYHTTRGEPQPPQAITSQPTDGIVHLARWNGASFDALAECWEHRLDVVISSGARIAALVTHYASPRSEQLHLRRTLYRAQRDPQWCVDTVRMIIDRKIGNQLALLRLYHDHPEIAWERDTPLAREASWGERYTTALRRLRACRQSLPEARSMESLRGLEGQAARVYFGSWPPLIAQSDFRRRARALADPTNLLLDLCYARLAHRTTLHLLDCGLDSAAGMLHADDDGRPSLALDLMEPLRPLIADRFCLRLIRQRHQEWFEEPGPDGRWQLTQAGWRQLNERWKAWLYGSGQRPGVDTLIAHTVHGFARWISHAEPLDLPRLR